jgi:hypothetical protein
MPHCGSKAHALNPWFADGPVRWVRSLNSACRTYTMVSPVVRGDTAVTPRGTRADEPRCRSCDVPLMLPFQAPTGSTWNTTNELHNITARYATRI